MTQELKNKMQQAYDTLIKYSNNAFANSKEDLPPSIQQNFYGKSEAYEAAARVLDATLAVAGIYIETEDTDREIQSNLDRREACEADAEFETAEIEYHEA
ncbi:hypothetical protein ABDK00_014235 [Niabella insulamsoli]|uniref:hypothetical protein n=1 Tax=Niabella insulamsoli TaxID=3144874 RepID=UPI0031FE1259